MKGSDGRRLHIAVHCSWRLTAAAAAPRGHRQDQGRSSPAASVRRVLQAYYDLARLFRKGSVLQHDHDLGLPGRAGGRSRDAPLLAMLLIPLRHARAPISFAGDLILFAYLFGLGRFFTASSALDTGSSFEGMGAAREVTFACLAEPALFFGPPRAGEALRDRSPCRHARRRRSAPHWLTARRSLSLVRAELVHRAPGRELAASRSTIPNTHLELTMIHEVMVLDHSGPAFGMILYGAALKLFAFGGAIVRVALPVHSGQRLARLAGVPRRDARSWRSRSGWWSRSWRACG